MEKQFKVAALVGSLCKGSFTRMVAKALIRLAPPSLSCEIVEIGDSPLNNEDSDATARSWWG
jgi:chromate reductase